jgi:CBS domain-containing protein
MGIKSFQGDLVGKAAPKALQIRVEDHMNKAVVCFNPSQTILEVMDAIIKNGISGGPIVSEHNEILGIISEGDCIKQITESKYYNLPLNEMNIGHYMTVNVICVNPNDSIFDVADKFLTTKKRNFPVILEGKVIGLISQKNVLKAVLHCESANWQKNHS